MSILQQLGSKTIILDGAMGSLLEQRGLSLGQTPERHNIENPEILIDIHKSYIESGSDIILTNTFGANSIKLLGTGFTCEKLITAAVDNAKKAVKLSGKSDVLIALDIGPTGKLLKPLGELSFDDAYSAFKQMVQIGVQNGVDLIYIETMSDTLELKAAVLAAKENSSLPVFATVTLDENGKLLTGADVSVVSTMLEGLKVDAIGLNCGYGPDKMLPYAKAMLENTYLPVIIKPNAGLPEVCKGKTVYSMRPEEFVQYIEPIAKLGACILGGCCGTTPEFIEKLAEQFKSQAVIKRYIKKKTVVSSYTHTCEIAEAPVIIGERINPTGKRKLKQALIDNNMQYIISEALAQSEHGADILDVNVGLAEIDEAVMLPQVVQAVQQVVDKPLQIDSSDTKAMELALRYYNGKAMINSVNGKAESMREVFPLVKKYGGVVVGLTLDEGGIPDTAEGRLEIAKKIIDTAAGYGIDKSDIVIDVLCMTVSYDNNAAKTTLQALKLVKEQLGVKTVLGVSNVSFGLPHRENINSAFYSLALSCGLNCAIINPCSDNMMRTYYSYKVLSGLDQGCKKYIEKFTDTDENQQRPVSQQESLSKVIENGVKDKAALMTKQMLGSLKPLEIIDNELIPALNTVGDKFEKGTLFLPQLLMSANAAKAAFNVIKEHLKQKGGNEEKNGTIVLATVKGDIHDIGKNIVKVLLENYNFEVVDLGKDVDIELIVDTVKQKNIKLVGLSALMTTTVVNMEKTIKSLREAGCDCKVMVGGAVLTQEYADTIGADFYAKDAMASVAYAQSVFKN